MRYFEFTDVEHRVYPQLALEVDPGDIVGFASSKAPDSRWKPSSKEKFDEQQAPAPVVEDHTPDDPETPDVSVDPPAEPAADQSSPAA